MPQFFGPGKPPAGVVFDSDMSGIDDALALALLFGLEGKNEARAISISVSTPNLSAAAFCDAVARFYTEPAGNPGAFARPAMPIGLALASKMAGDPPMTASPLARQAPDGKPLYRCGIHKLNDTAEVPALVRNALTAQFDQNAIVVLTGPATNLAELMRLPGISDLISQKVRYLCVSGPDDNIKRDIPAARKLFAEWPGPIVFSGSEIGNALLFPGASIETDFAWAPAHPIADAYRAYRPMPYDAPSWALAAMLYAVRPNAGYFQVSGPGTAAVADDGRVNFTPSPGGRHRQLALDPAQREHVVQTWTELVSAKPVPRMPRFRPPQKKAAPAAAALPGEKK
jgi:purine nucleosidase